MGRLFCRRARSISIRFAGNSRESETKRLSRSGVSITEAGESASARITCQRDGETGWFSTSVACSSGVIAGRLAGLTVLRIVNEPTAAALAYGVREAGSRRIVVYDLGGGTFDATCLAADDNTFTVKSSRGDKQLG